MASIISTHWGDPIERQGSCDASPIPQQHWSYLKPPSQLTAMPTMHFLPSYPPLSNGQFLSPTGQYNCLIPLLTLTPDLKNVNSSSFVHIRGEQWNPMSCPWCQGQSKLYECLNYAPGHWEPMLVIWAVVLAKQDGSLMCPHYQDAQYRVTSWERVRDWEHESRIQTSRTFSFHWGSFWCCQVGKAVANVLQRFWTLSKNLTHIHSISGQAFPPHSNMMLSLPFGRCQLFRLLTEY